MLRIQRRGQPRVRRAQWAILRQLSQDDTWPHSDGAYDPLQEASSAVVTQAIGGQSAFVDIEPHVVETQLMHGQRFLICSDGLTMNGRARRARSQPVGADDRATMRAWFDAAMRAGARDNLSVCSWCHRVNGRDGMA
jgi:PPM family protein phosphatase